MWAAGKQASRIQPSTSQGDAQVYLAALLPQTPLHHLCFTSTFSHALGGSVVSSSGLNLYYQLPSRPPPPLYTRQSLFTSHSLTALHYTSPNFHRMNTQIHIPPRYQFHILTVNCLRRMPTSSSSRSKSVMGSRGSGRSRRGQLPALGAPATIPGSRGGSRRGAATSQMSLARRRDQIPVHTIDFYKIKPQVSSLSLSLPIGVVGAAYAICSICGAL